MRVLMFMILVVIAFVVSGWRSVGYAGETTTGQQTEMLATKGDHSDHVRRLLLNQYKKWAKTPYRSGGMSRKGIDCSGLVRMIFSQEFGIELPRTVKYQARKGRNISKKNLEPGHLIFFKTGTRSRHVGIYLGNNEFLHASAKMGVIVSSLKNPYWAPRLWKIVKLK